MADVITLQLSLDEANAEIDALKKENDSLKRKVLELELMKRPPRSQQQINDGIDDDGGIKKNGTAVFTLDDSTGGEEGNAGRRRETPVEIREANQRAASAAEHDSNTPNGFADSANDLIDAPRVSNNTFSGDPSREEDDGEQNPHQHDEEKKEHKVNDGMVEFGITPSIEDRVSDFNRLPTDPDRTPSADSLQDGAIAAAGGIVKGAALTLSDHGGNAGDQNQDDDVGGRRSGEQQQEGNDAIATAESSNLQSRSNSLPKSVASHQSETPHRAADKRGGGENNIHHDDADPLDLPNGSETPPGFHFTADFTESEAEAVRDLMESTSAVSFNKKQEEEKARAKQQQHHHHQKQRHRGASKVGGVGKDDSFDGKDEEEESTPIASDQGGDSPSKHAAAAAAKKSPSSRHHDAAAPPPIEVITHAGSAHVNKVVNITGKTKTNQSTVSATGGNAAAAAGAEAHHEGFDDHESVTPPTASPNQPALSTTATAKDDDDGQKQQDKAQKKSSPATTPTLSASPHPNSSPLGSGGGGGAAKSPNLLSVQTTKDFGQVCVSHGSFSNSGIVSPMTGEIKMTTTRSTSPGAAPAAAVALPAAAMKDSHLVRYGASDMSLFQGAAAAAATASSATPAAAGTGSSPISNGSFRTGGGLMSETSVASYMCEFPRRQSIIAVAKKTQTPIARTATVAVTASYSDILKTMSGKNILQVELPSKEEEKKAVVAPDVAAERQQQQQQQQHVVEVAASAETAREKKAPAVPQRHHWDHDHDHDGSNNNDDESNHHCSSSQVVDVARTAGDDDDAAAAPGAVMAVEETNNKVFGIAASSVAQQHLDRLQGLLDHVSQVAVRCKSSRTQTR